MNIKGIYLNRLTHLFICIAGFLIIAAPAYCQNTFKLKPGAKGNVCLKCHENFKSQIKNRYVHPLMKNGECTGCHVTHTSAHKNLLKAAPSKLCYDCHKKILPENAASSHQIVLQGDCIKCHLPHGSDNKLFLKKTGNDLCLDCHEDIREKIKLNRFKHKPMEKGSGCLNCHVPHASEQLPFLLKKDSPSLCLGCHKTNESSFQKKHMNYPVANSNCRSCHNPHGSNEEGLLYDVAHTPVKEKKCDTCHLKPTSSGTPEIRKQGNQLCQQCHKETIDKLLSKNKVHWPLVDNTGCLNCHNPHATKQDKLLKGPVKTVCGKCHSDTVELQQISISNPKNKRLCEPVKTGNCVVCHLPHGADNILNIDQAEITNKPCGKCHEWQTHSTHPIGEKIVDSRNKNITIDCLSCHKACGTENNPSMLPFETTYDLCVDCHIDRKR
jgi:predicted CXXCH cytochrome family protein